MSISFTPGVYRDRADLQKQLDFYYKQLSIAAQNAAKIKDIDSNSITRAELKLAPQFTQRNSEDRLRDSSYQRQMAYEKLSSIFSTKDTDALLAELISKDEVLLFNTYADKFFDEYKINANTTTGLFLTNWKAFQKKLNAADFSNLGTTLSDIKSILETGNATQAQVIEEIKKSSLTASQKSDAIRSVLEASHVLSQEKLNELIAGIRNSSLTASEKSDAIRSVLETSNRTQNELIAEIQESSLTASEKSDAIRALLETNSKMQNDLIAEIKNSSLSSLEKQEAIRDILDNELTQPRYEGIDPNIPADMLEEAKKLLSLDSKELDQVFEDAYPNTRYYKLPEHGFVHTKKKKYLAIDTPEARDKMILAVLFKRFPNMMEIPTFPGLELFNMAQLRDSIDKYNKRIRTSFRVNENNKDTIMHRTARRTEELLKLNRVDTQAANKMLQGIQDEQKNSINQFEFIRSSLHNLGMAAEDTNGIVRGINDISQFHLSNIREQLLSSRTSQTQQSELLNEMNTLLTEMRGDNGDDLKAISDRLQDAGVAFNAQKAILEEIRTAEREQYELLRNSLRQAGLSVNEIKKVLADMQAQAAERAPATPQSDYLELVSMDLPNLRQMYEDQFRTVRQVPLLINNVRQYVNKEEANTKAKMAQAFVLSVYPNVDDNIFFDPERVGIVEETGQEEDNELLLQQTIRDVLENKVDLARQSIGQIDERRLSVDSRKTYNTIKNTLKVGEEVGNVRSALFRGNEEAEIKNQTHEASQILADYAIQLQTKEPKAVKSSITRKFNRVFAHETHVFIWHDTENRKVSIRKDSAAKFSSKKIEALILHEFPKAELTNMVIPFKNKGDGLKKFKVPKIPKHKPIGRYMIHIPSLQNGYISIYYPDQKSPLKGFPARAISSDLQDLMWGLTEEKNFDQKTYKKLNGGEKRLYDEILTLIRIDPSEIKGLAAHRRITDTERDECMEKLKILYGEVDAGNHSKKIIKDLKLLLLKMIDKKYISKAESNKMIYHLFAVES